MGAIVGATYALNPDWYYALSTMDTSGFPQPYAAPRSTLREHVVHALRLERTVQDMLFGWGVGRRSLPAGRQLLERLTLGRRLEDACPPVVAVATDLMTGERVLLRHGSAAEAVYASGALAGILPPHSAGDYLLADGAYVDIAPVDVARDFGTEIVIAVNLDQSRETPPPIRNGLQALMRALEICHYQHANLRFAEADLVLHPHFPFTIDTLDFSHKRLCVAAGVRAVRAASSDLRGLLGNGINRGSANLSGDG
jgi:NTE family protein